jgi:hypothetical protein
MSDWAFDYVLKPVPTGLQMGCRRGHCDYHGITTGAEQTNISQFYLDLKDGLMVYLVDECPKCHEHDLVCHLVDNR